MKIPGFDWLNTKYNFLKADAAKKGIVRSFSETLYEYKNKKKFKTIGISHPDSVLNLDITNAKSANKDSHENQPSTFYAMNKAFRQLDIKPSEISLLDIGCGSGRVLSFGMLLRFKAVFGVDLDEPALEKAIANCTKMQKMGYSSSFQISHEDACEYRIPDPVNVIYLFNPFGKKTMEKVVQNINMHAARSRFDIYILYSNPTFQELFIDGKRTRKIFESFYKTQKPDIAIFKIAAGA